jgi:geranylgeranyl pyrophosphate synthase
MAYQGREAEMNLPTIEAVNARKSGALIAVSLKAGAYLGGGSASQVESLYRYGKAVGLLFQVVDDIMDKQGYARVIGISEAAQEAQRLLHKAKSALKPFKARGEILSKIADFVATRKN